MVAYGFSPEKVKQKAGQTYRLTCCCFWWAMLDSNQRPHPCEGQI